MGSFLSIRNMRKIYRNGTGVRDASMDIEQGEIHAFLGMNGAGKSTTILCTLGLVKRDAGSVSLGGKSFTPGDWRIRRNIGYAPELPSLPSYLTAEECLITYGLMRGLKRSEVKSQALELLDYMDLLEYSGSRVSELSRGTVARLDIAISLLGKPEVLILDEPTASLDPVSRSAALKKMSSLSSEGMTIMLSSHLLGDVEKICGSATIIHQGRTIMNVDVPTLSGSMQRNICFNATFDSVDSGLIRVLSEIPSAKKVLPDDSKSLEICAAEGTDLGKQVAEAAAATGHVMTGFYRKKESLEEFFMKVLEQYDESG